MAPKKTYSHDQMFLTRNYRISDFSFPLSLEDKIRVFEDQILGWHLEIAEWIVKSRSKHAKHSGYAALQIVLSYFEMYAKYEKGFLEDNQSKKFFQIGMKSVFPDIEKHPQKRAISELLEVFYNKGRCGLYHALRAGPGIVLSWQFPQSIQYDSVNRNVGINPKKLVASILLHFRKYIKRLNDPLNIEPRKNFEAKFNQESKVTT